MRSVAITDSHETLSKNSFSRQLYIKLADFRDALLCDRQLQFIIAFILIINLAFIGIHCLVQILRYFFSFDELMATLHLNPLSLLIDVDRSLAEWFNYLQATMCAAMLLGVFRVTRQPVYAAWALIFFFVAMDDSLNIHERGASYIVTTFGFPALPGLGSQASASLLVWALIGSVLVGILWWSIARSRRDARAAGGVLALAFASLIFFAMGMDMLHTAFTGAHPVVTALLAVLEDGGEMLSVALACALALIMYRHPTIAG